MDEDVRPAQRRGVRLHTHILMSAKDVFLETGYERASMDAVAARAGTSKRSLYAHFASKERLFLAVLDLVRELYLERLRTPDVYAADPAEAIVVFCGRFLQLLVWEPQLRTCRLSIAEAQRLPGHSTAYFEAIFTSAYERLATYLDQHYDLDEPAATSRSLLNAAVLPRMFRTLLDVDAPIREPPEVAALARQVDLAPIRAAVAAALPSGRARSPA